MILIDKWTNKIVQGDAVNVLKEFLDESIDCVLTSPPYWALRDYGIEPSIWDGKKDCEHKWISNSKIKETFTKSGSGWLIGHEKGNKEAKMISRKERPEYWKKEEIKTDFCSKCGAWKGTLGLEPTFELYIKHLCDIFDEIKRVLKKTGTVWVNLGDTYSGAKVGNTNASTGAIGKPRYSGDFTKTFKKQKQDIQDKSLIGIPHRFMIEMLNRGWILRNDIIWWKPNCMPSSAKDRFTVDFEYLFFFTKSKKYYFEKQTVPTTTFDTNVRDRDKTKLNNTPGRTRMAGLRINSYSERNLRTVWRICPTPFPEAHFAVFPEELCETPIKAGCPEFVCKKCGKPREKILKPSEEYGKYLKPYRLNHVNKIELGRYIKEHRRELNLSQDQLCEKLGLNKIGHGGMVNHFENGRAIPTIEQWKLMKGILKLDDKFDKLITNFSIQKEEYEWKKDLRTHHKVSKTLNATYKIIDYTSCNCNAGFKPGIVLDPFCGAGTTCLVAKKLGRNYIGIDIKEEYCKMARKRLNKVPEKLTSF